MVNQVSYSRLICNIGRALPPIIICYVTNASQVLFGTSCQRCFLPVFLRLFSYQFTVYFSLHIFYSCRFHARDIQMPRAWMPRSLQFILNGAMYFVTHQSYMAYVSLLIDLSISQHLKYTSKMVMRDPPIYELMALTAHSNTNHNIIFILFFVSAVIIVTYYSITLLLLLFCQVLNIPKNV